MLIVFKYFPNLSDSQKEQFETLTSLFTDWNTKINLVSRKDIDYFAEHHLLHSLSIAKFIRFTTDSKIIDVGTGGGLPGIPLAVMYPDVQFILIDSIGKKIKAVNSMINSIGLKNVKAYETRSETLKSKFDFVVSRAVAPLPLFIKQTAHLISTKQQNAISNGIIYLKGGDITHEIMPFKRMTSVFEIKSFFPENYFSGKKLVHISIN
ncbi:MAG: 16S rRNA (guanine(527)-N(7))-methyltransferase RsmG [Marinilabiliaceae bacterium]|nr:16S rRNA (guanine(527)-N(7))-methyltransferase RsmG [Marinilabiliaceae bacterium]